jgi:mono/diheme cytochrome c family protein
MQPRQRRDKHSAATRIATALLLAEIAAPVLVGGQEFPADVNRGRGVYERHCQRCHGAGGWGDGPDAASLTVRPTNFHLFRSYLKSDEELRRTIEFGVVFSPMHAWQGELTENEVHDVLAYIRLLSQQGR